MTRAMTRANTRANPRLAAAALALVVCLAAGPALAQSLADVEAADAAVYSVWEKTPLTFRKTLFVTDAPAFGVYTEKPDATFKPGEQVILYTEPVGFGYKQNPDGTYTFGFNFDLTVRAPGGEVVAEQKDFAKVDFTSHARNREFLVTVTLDLTDAPAGNYVIEYVAHDIASDKTATIAKPLTILE